jgi:hypothetical protein
MVRCPFHRGSDLIGAREAFVEGYGHGLLKLVLSGKIDDCAGGRSQRKALAGTKVAAVEVPNAMQREAWSRMACPRSRENDAAGPIE